MRVIDGAIVWNLHATHGFPLELSLPILADRGIVPAWDKLLESAAADGANLERLTRRIMELAVEAYGPKAGAVIRERLPLLLARLGSAS